MRWRDGVVNNDYLTNLCFGVLGNNEYLVGKVRYYNVTKERTTLKWCIFGYSYFCSKMKVTLRNVFLQERYSDISMSG